MGMDPGALGLYVCLFIALYFEVFLLISFFERRPQKKAAPPPARSPKVSMLVPCFNEERTLSATVDSLLAMHYPADKLEVLIIDDGSSDGTAAIGQQYATRYPGRVSFLQKANGGKYTALNLGIKHSSGELIGCLAADSFAAQDALMEAVKMFGNDPATVAITPGMQVYKPRTMLELMQSVEYPFGIFYKKMFDNLSAINVLPGPFSMYRREVFKKIGLFRHAHNTEDMEIAFRMHAHGLRIVNAHTAYVYTTVPTTVRSLLRQRTRWSQGFLQNARDYKYMFFNRRFGNFGMLVLPFALSAFVAGIYSVLYVVYRFASVGVERLGDRFATGVPLTLPHLPHIDWFFLNVGMMSFVVAAVLLLTLVAIWIGSDIAKTRLTPKAFFAYFAFFGLLAPLWLIKAAWGAALARESAWR